eukprot:15466440-Alexandrium_andersonii.AAC.1
MFDRQGLADRRGRSDLTEGTRSLDGKDSPCGEGPSGVHPMGTQPEKYSRRCTCRAYQSAPDCAKEERTLARQA